MVTRGRALAPLAATLLAATGCNAVLGIGSHALSAGADAAAGADGGAAGTGGPDARPPAADGGDEAGLCSPGGWCRDFTPPQTDTLRAAWSAGTNDTWAVGDSGTLIHWNGAVWGASPATATQTLRGVWGNGSNDIWAVGHDPSMSKAVTLRWNGTVWATVINASSAPLYGVWSSGRDDAWAVGSGGAIQRWTVDKSTGVGTWSAVSDPTLPKDLTDFLLTSVWGTGPDNVWVVGSGGIILHWTDGAWSRPPNVLTTVTLRRVWGDSNAHVWAVGDGGTILNFDGATWSKVEGGTTQDLNVVWGTQTSSDILATGAPSYVWIAGAAGTILRWDGKAWSDLTNPALARGAFLGLSGSGWDEAWAVGEADQRLHWVGNSWLTSDSSLPESENFKSVWGSGPNDVWAVGEGGNIIHWNGTAWFIVSSFATNNALTPVVLNRIWGSGTNDVWFVGDAGTILHWNGASLCLVGSGVCVTAAANGAANGAVIPANPKSLDLFGVGGIGPNDVWFVGQLGTILHWDGSAFRVDPSPNANLLASVWSVGSDAWAVGDQGTILHRSNGVWSDLTDGNRTTALLNGVWGSGPNNVWIVGDNETIWRWNGNDDWTEFSDPDAIASPPALLWVWGRGTNDVWATGDSGVILSWDGSGSWKPSPSGVTRFIAAVWGSGPGDIWAVGEDGTLLHH